MREKAKEKQLQRQLKRQKYEESQAGRKKKGIHSEFEQFYFIFLFSTRIG